MNIHGTGLFYRCMKAINNNLSLLSKIIYRINDFIRCIFTFIYSQIFINMSINQPQLINIAN